MIKKSELIEIMQHNYESMDSNSIEISKHNMKLIAEAYKHGQITVKELSEVIDYNQNYVTIPLRAMFDC